MMRKSQIRLPLTFQIYLFAQLLIPGLAHAGGKSHKAHEHGNAQVNVVAEAKSVTLVLESPSDGIYGFEHEAKKPDDIKKRDVAVEKLKSNAEKMFLLDSSLGCKLVSSDVNPFVTESESESEKNKKKHNHKKGTHSEVHATFKFECEKPVAGTVLKFALTPFFKSLKKLQVQVISGDKQNGATIKNDAGSVNL